MPHFVAHLANWFVTGVWPNLVASAITFGAGIWWHHTRMQRHVSAEIAKLHERVDGLRLATTLTGRRLVSLDELRGQPRSVLPEPPQTPPTGGEETP